MRALTKTKRSNRRPQAFSLAQRNAAVAHLKAVDPRLADLIQAVGPVKLYLEPNRFYSLVRTIIGQQISTKAAAAICLRFREAFSTLSPDEVLRARVEDLRALGLSARKADYVRGVAEKTADGSLALATLHELDDEAVIEALVTLKGIGRWSAEMFLIFSLGRLDVMPFDDYGVRAALQRLHGLKALPDKERMRRLTATWSPYSSVGTWYLWRSLGFVPQGSPTA